MRAARQRAWIGMGLYATTAWALFAVALVEIGIGIARPMFWTVPPLFLSRTAMAGAIALISCFAILAESSVRS